MSDFGRGNGINYASLSPFIASQGFMISSLLDLRQILLLIGCRDFQKLHCLLCGILQFFHNRLYTLDPVLALNASINIEPGV